MNVLSINPDAVYSKRVSPARGIVLPIAPKLHSDRVDISFGAKDYSNVKPINLDEAKEISGIHCPGCGVKMLSQKDFESIGKRAENIQTAAELVDLFKEYKKFIPTNMRKILSNTDDPQNYENKTVREYYNEHRTEAFYKKRERVHRAKDFLIDYSKNIDETKRDDFIEKVQDLTSKDSYTDYKSKILYLTENYNLSGEEQNLIKKRTLKDVATSSNYFNIYSIKNYNEISDNEIAKILVNRVFRHSLSNVAPINKYPDYIDHPHNKLLLCKNCNSNSSKYVFWKTDTNPKLKDNITKYLTDIAKLMGENKIEYNKKYIDTFCHISNILSSGKIDFREKDINHLYNLRHLVTRHEEFLPIVQTKVDIPCAQCGSTLLPHAIRRNIEDELSDCCCPDEYAQVLKKYYKYIGYYAKDFADDFIKITESNPNISNEDFIKIFRGKAEKKLIKETLAALRKYSQGRDYVYKNRSVNDLAVYDKVDYIVNNYYLSGKLRDYNYMNFFTECFKDINLAYTPKGISVLISDINKICYKASLVYGNSKYDFNDNDAVYTILFNFFKSDVATADHLIALQKGGSNDKNNLVGLCKACNTLKSNKSVKSWYGQNMGVRKNFLNHLQVIDNAAKKGELEGFDDWAKNISRLMYEKTDHAFDLRKYFD